jgi:cytochrome c553
MKQSVIIACMVILAGNTAVAATGGDPVAGRTRAAICSTCHGVDGNSPDPEVNPSLAGMDENYLFTATKAYVDGEREHEIMRAMLLEFSDRDIANISAFYASQEAE